MVAAPAIKKGGQNTEIGSRFRHFLDHFAYLFGSPVLPRGLALIAIAFFDEWIHFIAFGNLFIAASLYSRKERLYVCVWNSHRLKIGGLYKHVA